ncbi:hypothetical protein TGAMA5MH_09982 [Trichoderma gamsii]|uniref:Nephrocystin 3-like N-terminal domain-containing protein n=1 Tax=Trichoderma gamsii TaxID=398673 RepID=A0A2K0SXW7_9HYPO|nr:hypothetical protein TGAMA5MH_09982 [Trichoderma gamsii]
MRDHWSQNGILSCLAEWRHLCDDSQNSVLWISSENNGRQFWLTEFSINLIDICRSQGQLVTFAMCDRPKSAKWTPQHVLKHLVSQMLLSRPDLANSAPHIFNTRQFRKASTFDSVFNLLHSIVGLLASVIVVVDRLDRCVPESAAQHVNIADALSMLVKLHRRNLKVIVTTGQVVSPSMLPGLPISFAVVSTKRRPRLLEYKNSPVPRRGINEMRSVYHPDSLD